MTSTFIEYAAVAYGLMALCTPEAEALQRADQRLQQLKHPAEQIAAARGVVEGKIKEWARA